MDDHRRRRASDRPSSGRRFGWQLEELVLSAGQAPAHSSDRAPNAGQSSVSASLSLSLLAGPRTPREPGLFRLSCLLLRSTPPRERGFVNLILLRTSKKITIPNGGRARAAPENDPDCHVSADIRAAGGSTSAVTLGWSLFAACCNPGGSLGPLREPLLAALRYTHRKQLKASFPGCAGFGRCGVPSALVWRAARPLLPLLSGSPACWGARAVLTAPRATSVGPAGAPRRRFGARNLPPTRQARGSCRRCLSKRAHAC